MGYKVESHDPPRSELRTTSFIQKTVHIQDKVQKVDVKRGGNARRYGAILCLERKNMCSNDGSKT